MLNKSGKSGNSCLILRGNALDFSLLSMMLAVVLSHLVFSMLWYFSSVSTFWRVFNHK